MKSIAYLASRLVGLGIIVVFFLVAPRLLATLQELASFSTASMTPHLSFMGKDGARLAAGLLAGSVIALVFYGFARGSYLAIKKGVPAFRAWLLKD